MTVVGELDSATTSASCPVPPRSSWPVEAAVDDSAVVITPGALRFLGFGDAMLEGGTAEADSGRFGDDTVLIPGCDETARVLGESVFGLRLEGGEELRE